MSRPEKPIDWALVDKLLIAGCLGTEIAPHFDMHPETFYDRVQDKYGIGFTEYSQKKRSQGDGRLRLKQFDKAESGDNTLLIWLGKNRLGQKDTQEVAVQPETMLQFTSIMNQLADLQKNRVVDEKQKPQPPSYC